MFISRPDGLIGKYRMIKHGPNKHNKPNPQRYPYLIYCTVLYSTVLYSALLYCHLLCYIVLCSALLYSALLFSTLLYCPLLYGTLLCFTLLYCAPHCVAVLLTVLQVQPALSDIPEHGQRRAEQSLVHRPEGSETQAVHQHHRGRRIAHIECGGWGLF